MGNCLQSDTKKKRRKPTKSEFDMLKIYKYHKNNVSQINYFNQEEKEEIELFLKEEAKEKMSSKIKKKISCEEDSEIGRGSFSTVARGFDKNNNMYMAVKKVKIVEFPSNKEEIESLHREIEVLSELKHPNIVTYYGSKKKSKNLLIYMEFMNLGSIENALKDFGKFPVEITAKYTEQILLGLDYLHKHNIIHRDIKTANILVNNWGEVKLSDFGCAKYITGGVQSVAGTPGYMAPEVG